MIDLFERADPAIGVEVDGARLRAKVEERLGLTPPLQPLQAKTRRPWLIAAVSFAVVIAFAIPSILSQDTPSVFAPSLEGIADLPGVQAVVPLASGGLQAMAVDGQTIWVMTTLANVLQKVSANSGDIEATYEIDARVEGVVVGDGFVWLASPDNGGEVLRFDPAMGAVDATIPIGGSPSWAHWLGESLWISNEDSELIQISAQGAIVSTRVGELKGGEGLGYLWVNDPDTELISSLSEDGTVGEIVIPTEPGLDTMSGPGIRQVVEAGGRLFLLDGDYPWGTNLAVFDPTTGEFGPFASLTFGLLDLIEYNGYLWVTSHTDHLLIRIDPETGEQRRYPMPGKAAGLAVADGALWVTLYHPGALIRLDTNADLLEAGEIVVDNWNGFPHRLLCTGSGNAGGPTIILEPIDWIEYGSWSVIQAMLSEEGYVVCANGYMEGEATPQQRSADLNEALTEAGIPGPYVLVAAGDGVHSTRIFADGRDDIAGVVLVDPVPIGFQDLFDELYPPDSGRPSWLDLNPAVSESLDDFGRVPLVVIGGDPEAVFLSQHFIDGEGRERAESLNGAWEDGLAFYAGLSTDSRSVVADGTGQHMVVWNQPDLVVEEVLDVLSRADTG
jgi:hypothetical protein